MIIKLKVFHIHSPLLLNNDFLTYLLYQKTYSHFIALMKFLLLAKYLNFLMTHFNHLSYFLYVSSAPFPPLLKCKILSGI
ncbi:hypothetical protein CW304_26845 [Bacillus sp. UFRGS-B20]|nr:hypothetical protein CW304_26845 [Bacillus sp. UFRGS-B20]